MRRVALLGLLLVAATSAAVGPVPPSKTGRLTGLFFGDGGTDVGVWWYVNQYYIATHDSDDWYVGFVFAEGAIANGADSASSSSGVWGYRRITGIHHADAGMTLSGTWTAPGTGTYFGGSYKYTAETGAYAQATTPAGATRVGAFCGGGALANGGVWRVTINGDDTLATSLPTAQSLVDAAKIPDTCLVANGGALDPTDRVYDQYQATGIDQYPFWWIEFADGLAAGAHTVRVSVTDCQNVAAGRIGCTSLELGTTLGS